MFEVVGGGRGDLLYGKGRGGLLLPSDLLHERGGNDKRLGREQKKKWRGDGRAEIDCAECAFSLPPHPAPPGNQDIFPLQRTTVEMLAQTFPGSWGIDKKSKGREKRPYVHPAFDD